MATSKNYIPELQQYTDNQIILSSGRVLLHAKTDSILLFGKKSIGLSSLGTVNFDVANRVIVNSPKIELGLEAELTGEPVMKGTSTTQFLVRMLNILIPLGTALSNISQSEPETIIPLLVKAGTLIKSEFPQLVALANASGSALVSQVTYTK
jgi:hypothetical protein